MHKHELFIKRININKIEKIIISRGLQESNKESFNRLLDKKRGYNPYRTNILIAFWLSSSS